MSVLPVTRLTPEDLCERIARLPRIPFAFTPTPLEEAVLATSNVRSAMVALRCASGNRHATDAESSQNRVVLPNRPVATAAGGTRRCASAHPARAGPLPAQVLSRAVALLVRQRA